MTDDLEYYCKCGYHTDISTRMMIHLTAWPTLLERILRKHVWTYAIVKKPTILEAS